MTIILNDRELRALTAAALQNAEHKDFYDRRSAEYEGLECILIQGQNSKSVTVDFFEVKK